MTDDLLKDLGLKCFKHCDGSLELLAALLKK